MCLADKQTKQMGNVPTAVPTPPTTTEVHYCEKSTIIRGIRKN
jgi:hypothetical protein